ncbi:5'-methylthioadenosine/adenosylhomocysteine nucleosidase [Xylophilus sp. GW821-FHT01B05]
MPLTAHAPTAILSALPEEQAGLAMRLAAPVASSHAGRSFVQGTLDGLPVVLALSGIGKVAAASTATLLIERFGAARILFTGVAGGLGAQVRVGDVVVARDFVQHDMNAAPLFPRFEVPLTGVSRFPADAALTDALLQAARAALADPDLVDAAERLRFGLQQPKVHHGLLASGDRFVSSHAEVAELRAALPEALAVDMESAAVAQVCAAYGLPFAAVRTVSDRADDAAHVDFPAFVTAVASRYAGVIMGCYLNNS